VPAAVVDRDGKRFVVHPRPDAGAQKGSVHVTALENFSGELRSKVPTADVGREVV
jgi:hypothetical protein